MSKSNRALWIGASVLVLAGVGYFVYKKFFKNSDKKAKEECESNGRTWNSETKSCDLPEESSTTSSSTQSSTPKTEIKTGKANIDLLMSRLGSKGRLSKTNNGKYFVEILDPFVPIGKNNKIQFYETDIFWFGSKDGKMIAKGIYGDGGRKLVVTEGKNKGINAITNSLYDSVKIILKDKNKQNASTDSSSTFNPYMLAPSILIPGMVIPTLP
jgi:hypothetical protein